MKRSTTIALLAALVLALSMTVTALAQDTDTADDSAGPAVTCPNFVDADGDGICDNAGTGMHQGAAYGRSSGMGRSMANGQGAAMMRRGQGMGPGAGAMGQNFVDEDGDGVCDNCPADGSNAQARMGRSSQMHGQFQRFGGHHGRNR